MGQSQIFRPGDFEIGGIPRHKMHGFLGELFDQRSLVCAKPAGRPSGAVGFEERSQPKHLRRLHRPETFAVYGALYDQSVVGGFQRVRDGQSRDSVPEALGAGQTAVNDSGRD